MSSCILPFLFIVPRCTTTLHSVWSDLCTQGSLREGDAGLRRECKELLSLSAVGGAKVEVVVDTVAKVVVKMAFTLLAAASRGVRGNIINAGALEEASSFADFGLLSDTNLELEQYMLLPKAVVEMLLEQLPEHYQASQEVVEALRVKLSVLVHRVGQLIEQKAWVQNASYKNALAELVGGDIP